MTSPFQNHIALVTGANDPESLGFGIAREEDVGFGFSNGQQGCGASCSAARSQSVSFIKLGSLFPQGFDLFGVPLIPER